jgi:S-layer protein (TIGR01567 family)
MKSIAIFLLIIAFLTSPSFAGEIRGTIYNVSDGIVVWNSSDFPGFFQDINKGIGTERLNLNISGERVEPGAAQYISSMQITAFEHKEWGSYRVLCFLGEEYFAGYSDDCRIASPWNSLTEGNLSKVLIDAAERRTLASNEALPLAEGYSLELSDAEKGVNVSLYKNSSLENTTVIQPPADYVYTAKIGNHNTTLIAVHIKSNVRLTPNSYYTVAGIFQVSEKATPIRAGTTYGMMKLKSIEDSELLLINNVSLNITRNKEIEVVDGVKIKTANSSTSPNRIYVYKNRTELRNQEIRGTATDLGNNEFTWTPENFAGFYKDIDNNIGFEQLTFSLSNVNADKKSAELSDLMDANGHRGITYIASAQKKGFQFKPWGYYYNMSFLGQSYFAGYLEGSGFEDGILWHKSKEPNLLANSQLSKVLVDNGEPHMVKSGTSLKLNDGFEARLLVDDSCNKTLLELYENGNLTDRDYFTVPHTYVFIKDLGASKSVAVLALHISGVNCTRGKTCVVDGIFQISNSSTSIDIKQHYDKMSIRNIDPSEMTIAMDNKDNPITLLKNMDMPLMNNIYIKTANQKVIDSEHPLMYYVYTPTIGSPTK